MNCYHIVAKPSVVREVCNRDKKGSFHQVAFRNDRTKVLLTRFGRQWSVAIFRNPDDLKAVEVCSETLTRGKAFDFAEEIILFG